MILPLMHFSKKKTRNTHTHTHTKPISSVAKPTAFRVHTLNYCLKSKDLYLRWYHKLKICDKIPEWSAQYAQTSDQQNRKI